MANQEARLACPACGSVEWVEEHVIEVVAASTDPRLHSVPRAETFRLRCASCGQTHSGGG